MKFSSDKFNILYLDDEQSNLEIFRISFKRDYNVFAVTEPDEAFDVLRNQPIHVILTDQQMPIMKGTEFLEKTLEGYPDAIRMILTGYADINVVMEAINKCGIYKYITKPWERSDVKLVIDKALETHKIRMENKWMMDNLEKNLTNLENKYFEQLKQAKEYSRRLEKKNQEISAIRKKIDNNIHYASKIQHALLPTEEDLSGFFKDSFDIVAPLDVVSGDFYWFSKISDTEAYLAVVDCTGHGVSGSLMSIIGHNLFSKAIREHNLREPKDILEDIHQELSNHIFGGTTNTDGMDAALCYFKKLDDDQYKLVFSGAKRPLYVIEDNFLLEIQGSRKSIGGLQIHPNGEYTQHTIYLQKGDQIYLFTDGWTDIANEDRKKYGLKRLKELIANTKDLPAEEQKIMMMQDLAEYKQDTPQRDDILLVSVRL
ncbi:hypothetical protein AD998_13005 [bacterium 336/3]|nr:hypothetical protein AD998_13005 [bacterium 336/3]